MFIWSFHRRPGDLASEKTKSPSPTAKVRHFVGRSLRSSTNTRIPRSHLEATQWSAYCSFQWNKTPHTRHYLVNTMTQIPRTLAHGGEHKKDGSITIKSSESPNSSVRCSFQILSRFDLLMCFWNAKISSQRISPCFINVKVSRESIMISKIDTDRIEPEKLVFGGLWRRKTELIRQHDSPTPIPANFWKQVVIASEWWVLAHMKSLLSFAWQVRAFNTC